MLTPAILGGEPAFQPGLPIARPYVPPLENVTARLAPSYEKGMLTNSALVREFEEAAAQHLGVKHAIAVSSCTSGLMLVLRALQVESSVVLPSFTFSASAHAVAWNGAVPVFCECDEESFLIDVDDASARIDARTGALMATHTFGTPAPVEALEAAAAAAGVPLVFDAAHGMGALRQGRTLGGFGDAEIFSLSPTKLVVAGEGGLVTTNRDDVAASVRIGRDYANPGDYDTRFVGLNARMSELHAAVALESLALLDDHVRTRNALAARYRDGLRDIPGLAPQAVAGGDRSGYKDFTIAVDPGTYGIDRDTLVDALKADGVDTRKYFSPPVHRQQSHASTGANLPITDRVASRVVSLPMFAALQPEQVDRIIEVLASLHAKAAEVQSR